MSDYTLTTADIRERFTDWYDGPKAPLLDEAKAEFDRWLEQHDKEVAKATEERIIKLITDNDVIGANWWIRLIKGETK